MKQLILIAALALANMGLSGCADFEVYNPKSGESPSAFAARHFAQAGRSFAQACQQIGNALDQAIPVAAQAAGAYYAGRAQAYSAPPHYYAPLAPIDIGRSGTIIGPGGISHYSLNPDGSGMILGPDGITFIH